MFRCSSAAPLVDLRRGFASVLGICDRLTRNGFSISSHLESIALWRTVVRDVVGPVTQADFDLVSHFDVQAFPKRFWDCPRDWV